MLNSVPLTHTNNEVAQRNGPGPMQCKKLRPGLQNRHMESVLAAAPLEVLEEHATWLRMTQPDGFSTECMFLRSRSGARHMLRAGTLSPPRRLLAWAHAVQIWGSKMDPFSGAPMIVFHKGGPNWGSILAPCFGTCGPPKPLQNSEKPAPHGLAFLCFLDCDLVDLRPRETAVSTRKCREPAQVCPNKKHSTWWPETFQRPAGCESKKHGVRRDTTDKSRYQTLLIS